MSNLIIDRLNLFAIWIVTTLIILVVAAIILRLIADSANLNFFGWTYVTIRRLTDPLIVPVRGALRGFRVDPKYAPLVTILITILLGWLVVRLTDTILFTIAGVMTGIQQQAVGRVIGFLLYGFLAIYLLLIFTRIVFSWVMASYQNRVMRFLVNTTEPLLGPLRRTVPPVGMFDISALVAIIIIWLLQAAIAGTLLRS
jgi:YggT family protein